MMPAPPQDSASCRGPILESLSFLPFWKRFRTATITSLLPSDRSHAQFRLDAVGHEAPRNEEFMSMDRLSRVIAGCCLTLAMAMAFSASGCRSMRNDVPHGKPYTTTGDTPPVGFNSAPHPSTSVGNGMYPNNNMNPGAPGSDASLGGAGAAQLGTPPSNASPFTPTNNAYRAGANTGGNP